MPLNRNPFVRLITATIMVGAIATTALITVIVTSSQPTVGTANIWVDGGTGSCAYNAAPTSYSASTACASLQAAYTKAPDASSTLTQVRLPCGDYSSKPSTFDDIAFSAAKDTRVADVSFSSEDDTTCVTLPTDTMTISAQHLQIHHMAMAQGQCVDSTTISVPVCAVLSITAQSTNSTNVAHDVLIDNFKGSIFVLGSPHDVTIQNSDFGPGFDSHPLIHTSGSQNPPPAVSYNILIKNTAIHDFFNTQACINNIPAGCFSGNHVGCSPTINNGHDITFDGVRMYNCEDLALLISPNLASVTNVTIKNSVLGYRTANPAGVWSASAISLGCDVVGSCGVHIVNQYDRSVTTGSVTLSGTGQAIPVSSSPSGWPSTVGGVYAWSSQSGVGNFGIDTSFNCTGRTTSAPFQLTGCTGSGTISSGSILYSAVGLGITGLKLINTSIPGNNANMTPSTTPADCIDPSTQTFGGCEMRGTLGIPDSATHTCSGNAAYSNGWTVEYSASTDVLCGTGTFLGTATGSPSACGGTAICLNNFKTSDYGIAADGYHLLGSSTMLHIIPFGLPWAVPTDVDGDSRASTPSVGADDGPSSATANAWINISAGANPQVCHPSCGYDSTKAFGSMQAAQTAMSNGDTAILKCGAYPAQVLSSGTKTTAVNYKAESYDTPTTWEGALVMTTCVTVDSLDVNIDKVHIAGLQATPSPWTSRGDAANAQFQDVMNCPTNPCTSASGSVNKGHLDVCSGISTCTGYTDILIDDWKGPGGTVSASGTTLDHANIGGFDYCFTGSANGYAHVIANGSGNAVVPFLGGDALHFPWPTGGTGLSNVTLRNSVMHDLLHGINNAEGISCTGFNSGTGPHADQLQGIGCATACVVDSNAWWTGGDKPIQWSTFGPSPPPMTGVFITNNVMIQGDFNTTNALGQNVADCSGIHVWNNISPIPNSPAPNCATAGPDTKNNLFYSTSSCSILPTATFSHNVFPSSSSAVCGTIGTQAKKCDVAWISLNTSSVFPRTAAPNPTLLGTDTCAQGFSDAQFPTNDWAGNTRPLGGAADAGPSEVGSTDTTPPTVSITAPSNGATVNGNAVAVDALAADNVGVVGVQFKLDGVNLGAEDTVAPYEVFWNTATSSNGNHTLSAVVRDAAGLTGTAPTITVTVNNSDTTAPTVSITSPTNGSIVSATINVQALASDNSGTVAGVQFFLDGNVLNAEDTVSPFSTSWNTTTSTNGTHTLVAQARDAAGNTALSPTITVTVNNADTTNPTASITSPVGGAIVNATIQVQATASDNSGSVSGVQFKLDGNILGAEDTTSPFAISWDTATTSNGNHTLTAVARDPSGNLGTSPGVTISVNNGGGVTTGASRATCTGGTCTNGTTPSSSGPTHVGSLNGNSTWNFSFYAPAGLTGTAPVVFVAGGGNNCGNVLNQNWTGGWQAAANAHRYLVVLPICPNGSSWDHFEEQGSAGSPTSDTAFIAAIVSYLSTHTLNGVTPDMARLYFTGGSAGGHFSRSVYCSQATVGSFRAVAVVAASSPTAGSPTFPYGGSTPQTTCFYTADRTVFLAYMAGTNNGDVFNDLCNLPAGTPCSNGQVITYWGRANTIIQMSQYMGCTSPTNVNSTAGPAAIVTTTYGSCSNYPGAISTAFEGVTVTPAGHSYPGINTSTGSTGFPAEKMSQFFDGTTN